MNNAGQQKFKTVMEARRSQKNSKIYTQALVSYSHHHRQLSCVSCNSFADFRSTGEFYC